MPHSSGKSRHEQVQRWYEQYGPALVAFACSILGKRGDAEDVLQQVFLKLLKGNMNVRNGAAKPYLFRAVRNTALNLGRDHRDNVTLGERAGDACERWFEAPAELMYWSARLERAICALPSEQSEVLTLKIWGEMTFEEIGTVLGISINTAASRYRYAIVRLRELIPADRGAE